MRTCHGEPLAECGIRLVGSGPECGTSSPYRSLSVYWAAAKGTQATLCFIMPVGDASGPEVTVAGHLACKLALWRA